MGTKTKMKNTAKGLKGKAKEAAGKVSHDRDLEAEGRTDQIAADLSKAGESARDALTR